MAGPVVRAGVYGCQAAAVRARPHSPISLSSGLGDSGAGAAPRGQRLGDGLAGWQGLGRVQGIVERLELVALLCLGEGLKAGGRAGTWMRAARSPRTAAAHLRLCLCLAAAGCGGLRQHLCDCASVACACGLCVHTCGMQARTRVRRRDSGSPGCRQRQRRLRCAVCWTVSRPQTRGRPCPGPAGARSLQRPHLSVRLSDRLCGAVTALRCENDGCRGEDTVPYGQGCVRRAAGSQRAKLRCAPVPPAQQPQPLRLLG